MPDVFTPEQIAQLLEAFFKAVGTRQYIGARYVPLFGRKDETSIEWDNSAPYEPLTIVLYQGNSFTSRQSVPAGVEITNELFWAETGNFNAQVEEYRRIVLAFEGRISELEGTLPNTTFTSTNTVEAAINALDTQTSEAINALDTSTTEAINDISNRVDSIISTNTNEVFITIDKENAVTFPIAASTYYAQGCTCDAYGNYYVVADVIGNAGHGLIYKFNSEMVMVGSPTAINTHANALEYDPVNNTIIFYISNAQIGIIDCNTMEIVKRTPSASNPTFNYSGIGLNNEYAVMNITGTYDYVLFRRYASTLNAIGVVSTPTAGSINFRQDGCMHNNTFYQLYSNGNVATRIRSISVGGTHACDYIITNVRKEFEGIFYKDDSFYVVSADFTLYKVNSQMLYSGLVNKLYLNPAVTLFRRKSINTNDDTSKYVTVTIGNNNYNIGVLQYIDRFNAQAYSCESLTINALGNSRVLVPVATTGAFNYRGITRSGKIIEVTYYTSTTYPQSLRLANIRYNIDGTEYNIYPTESQLTNLDELQTQLQTFFEEANSRGLELGSIGILGYGTFNTNTTALTSYDLNVGA